MNLRKYLAAAALLIPTMMFAAQEHKIIYAYGLATSFNDSTVYITEIQRLDSAWVDSKTGFLYSRDNYSYQLRDHLKTSGVATPTCVTVYATTRKEIEKKYFAMKKRYTTKELYNVKYIASHDFSYTCITPDENEQKVATKPKKERK